MLNRRHFTLAAGATALTGFPAVHAQSDKIVLGQSAAFTGPAAQLGIQLHAGAKLYFDQLNAQGGIGGRSVEIRKLDDGYEPARCEENTRKLLEEDIAALFAFVGTPTSAVALPLATKARVPFIAPFTGAMALRNPFNRYAFHVRASYNDETALIVKQLHNVGITKVAVFYQNDAYGKAGLDGVQAALTALNLKPVALATVERNSVDVAKAVETLNAAAPEAVVQITAYKSSAAYIRAARESGLWRRLLQRVLRGYTSFGRRAGQGRRRRGGIPGGALTLMWATRQFHANLPRLCARPTALCKPTFPAWRGISPPR